LVDTNGSPSLASVRYLTPGCRTWTTMVNDFWISGAHFDVLDPLILGKPGWHDKVRVVDDASGRDREIHRELDDRVGFAHRPAFGERPRFRSIHGTALFGAGIDPSDDAVDLRLRNASNFPVGALLVAAGEQEEIVEATEIELRPT